jgi:hypothetical protein
MEASMIRWLRAALFALSLTLVPAAAGAQTASSDTQATPAPQPAPQSAPQSGPERETYSENEILTATKNLFGETTEGLATVIEKVFKDLGQPNAYIAGEEFSGAIGVGLRYGEGMLNMAGGGSVKVYWQGPSIGFDLGGNASKVFVLVYRLAEPEQIYRRVPGVEGTYYLIAGVGVNYQSDGELTLAPIRTGVGLRSGVNIGYLHYSREFSWMPF